jgi:hypothetical protein
MTLNVGVASANVGQTAIFRAVASDGLTVTSASQSILFVTANPISLSGGTGGTAGSTIYQAPNGTVVTSNDTVYSSGANYYIGYMFNSVPTSNTAPGTAQYWLSNSAATGFLLFNFSSSNIQYLHDVVVYPRTRTDTVTSISSVEGSVDGVNYTPIFGAQAFTLSDPWNISTTIPIRSSVYKYIRLNLSKAGSWGLSLNEVVFNGF